jgi:excisionase family DNA binding protein
MEQMEEYDSQAQWFDSIEQNYPNRLLSIAQVRDRLPLSRARLYQLIDSGELPAVRVGRRVFVVSSVLEEFISSHESSHRSLEVDLPF